MLIKIFEFTAACLLMPAFITVFVYYAVSAITSIDSRLGLSASLFDTVVIVFSIAWFFQIIAYLAKDDPQNNKEKTAGFNDT